MRAPVLAAAIAALSAAAVPSPARAAEPVRFEAVLAGHAVLPAESFVPSPEDAPDFLQTSGKFTGPGDPARVAAEPTTGAAPPFRGQPVQGFSGIRRIGDGRYHVLTDNGFGSKQNSPDAMLFFHIVEPDFSTGKVKLERTIFLSDPDKVVPFPITMEGTAERYLTGADFDIEGFQVIGEEIVIGDEFGPYVIVADAATGTLKDFRQTEVDGTLVKSPDHYTMRLPDPGSALPDFSAKRSRGYEGFAASPDGETLYPLLEGPLWRDGQFEQTADGRTALRILEMKAKSREWTGRSWLYPLEGADHAIGDFNMIDESRGLVIERDGGEGDAEKACKDGSTSGCFETPAGFKRVYLIDFAGVEPGAPVHKVAYIDLLDIKDPDGLARQGKREDGRFTFPFVTIENVDRVDETHIIVANDNNFPFSKGRSPDARDDNEMILLEVAEFLQARAEP